MGPKLSDETITSISIFGVPQGLYCFVLLHTLLLNYSTLHFMRSPYCSSCLLLPTNALLSYTMAVFPSSLMYLFPSSVHLANTQHSASYHAGSGFEIARTFWTLSSSSSLPAVECRRLPFEQATIISSQSSMHIHSHISAIISAVYTVSLGPTYFYSQKSNMLRRNTIICCLKLWVFIGRWYCL